MSPELLVPEEAELDSGLPIEPAVYVGAVRELVRTGTIVTVAAVPANVREQIDLEKECSRELVTRDPDDPTDEPKTSEEIGWISDGFSSLMARIVKISARAAAVGHDITPFGEISAEEQTDIREYVLEEYLALCGVLSPTGVPAKSHYQSAPFLYKSAEDAARFIEANSDLGRSAATRVLTSSRADPEAAIEEVRSNIVIASAEFPTINPNDIKRIVVTSPNNYLNALREHAARHGLAIENSGQPLPEAGNFLRTLRQLVRTRQYGLDHPRSSPDLVQKIAAVSAEARALMDEVASQQGPAGMDAGYAMLRQGFQRKVELLTIASNRAWRKGDLPISTEQAPAEFRREFYTRVLGDFLTIHEALGSNLSQSSITQNPSLYYAAEEIQQIVADNSDLAPSLLRELVLRDTLHPEQAIEAFRAEVKERMKANPRLTLYYAGRAAIYGLQSGGAKAASEEAADKLSPNALVKELRGLYSKYSRGRPHRHMKLEIEERRPEITEHYEKLGWVFGGRELPENARQGLVKITETFMVVNDRAFRAGETSTSLSGLDLPDRLSLYELLADDFAKIGAMLNVRSAGDWARIPVLYASPEEIMRLHSQYDCLSDKAFRHVVFNNHDDLEGAFARAKQLKSDLQTWYPGISEEMASYFAASSPSNAAVFFMEHLRSISDRPSRYFDSKTENPKPTQVEEIHIYLRTKFRQRLAPEKRGFGEQVNQAIAEIRTRAATLIAKYPEAINIDERNLERFLDQLEDYIKASHALSEDGSFPSILELPASTQNRFIKSLYSNQRDLNQLIAGSSEHGKPKFRIYEFGFFHSALYLKALWRQYHAYLPRDVITYLALTSPRRPFDKLDDLVEYRANLVRENPALEPAIIRRELIAEARDR